MAGTVDIVIPIEAEPAMALTDSTEAVGRIVSRILRPQPGARSRCWKPCSGSV